MLYGFLNFILAFRLHIYIYISFFHPHLWLYLSKIYENGVWHEFQWFWRSSFKLSGRGSTPRPHHLSWLETHQGYHPKPHEWLGNYAFNDIIVYCNFVVYVMLYGILNFIPTFRLQMCVYIYVKYFYMFLCEWIQPENICWTHKPKPVSVREPVT